MFQETAKPYMLPIYDKFFASEQAYYLKELFETNGLHPLVQQPKETFDVATGANNADMYHTLHLPPDEFARADELILEEVKTNGIPEDYHLREFASKEMEDIIGRPDQWSKQDIAVARILLAEKGVEISQSEISILAEERFKKVREQVNLKTPAIIIMYMFCLIGHVGGFVVGPMLYFMKNSDYNGKKQFAFSEQTRKHGILLFLASFCSILGWYLLLH